MKSITLPVTPERFGAYRTKLVANGIPVPLDEDTATISHRGVVVRYRYDTAKATLTLELLRKPLLLPESMIEEKLREWFEA